MLPLKMILVIATILSITIVTLSLIKNRPKDTVKSIAGPNTELEMYYKMVSDNVNQSALQKQLLRAAAMYKKRLDEVDAERSILESLHEERMISEEFWNKIEESTKEMCLEMMCIEVEAENLKTGYSGTIFSESDKVKLGKEIKKNCRGNNNSLYVKKQETMQRSLVERIKAEQG